MFLSLCINFLLFSDKLLDIFECTIEYIYNSILNFSIVFFTSNMTTILYNVISASNTRIAELLEIPVIDANKKALEWSNN